MPRPAPFELSALVLSTLAIACALALGPLVVGLTSWSLFGLRRIIGAKAPFMGWGFVLIRTTRSFAFPVRAGCLVQLSFPA